MFGGGVSGETLVMWPEKLRDDVLDRCGLIADCHVVPPRNDSECRGFGREVGRWLRLSARPAEARASLGRSGIRGD